MKKVTVRNSFHGTEIRLVPIVGDDGLVRVSKSQAQRARRALCGIDGCSCSSALGARGPQDFDYQEEFGGSVLIGMYPDSRGVT